MCDARVTKQTQTWIHGHHTHTKHTKSEIILLLPKTNPFQVPYICHNGPGIKQKGKRQSRLQSIIRTS